MLKVNFQISGNWLALPRLNLSPASVSCSFKMKIQRFTSLRTRFNLCHASLDNLVDLKDRSRRSSEYQPTLWNHRLIESIGSHYNNGEFNTRIEELKNEIKQLLKETCDPPARLELIDSIRRLGLSYHFDKEIRFALLQFYVDGFKPSHGLKDTSLCFRLLREYGYNVSSDVFKIFIEGEEFMKCLSQDVKGLLSLYEATHLALPEEQILEEAKEFCVKHLQSLSQDVDMNLAEQVRRSLESPTYRMMPTLEARHYIDAYEKEETKSPCLLEMAKLDFNVVQALHQKDIKELSGWWEQVDLGRKFDFSRDRIFENYLWASGTAWEPKFSKCREVITKISSVGLVIDDFYDIHATLEEAQQLTTAIGRWDLEAMEGLPDDLKLCYLAVYNFVNETADDFLKDSGFDIRNILAKEAMCLCETYLREAQWFHKGITPSLEEYLENSWISVGNRAILFYAFYFVEHNFTEESLDHWEQTHHLIYLSSMLVRLMDDLAPSKAEMEGQASAVICRMKDKGESYETAKKYVRDLINIYWKKLNQEVIKGDHPQNFVHLAINTCRSCFTVFQLENDSLGNPAGLMKDRICSLFIEPIPME